MDTQTRPRARSISVDQLSFYPNSPSTPTLLLPQLSFYPHSTSVELESSWLIWAISRLAATYILLPTPSFLHSCFLLPTSYFLLPTSYFLLPTQSTWLIWAMSRLTKMTVITKT